MSSISRWSLTFPERWLKDGQLDDTLLDANSLVFGYGRRVCPGRYLSQDSLLYMTAALLSVFNVKDPFSTQPLSLDVTPELLCKISPFKCDIAPRSEAHAALIRSLDG
ncbi:cytochrome p450 [Coprinopsis cinerea AmutBmut pab1-1]|nr:cytochrome p450 [Coprinopsis cinerea AmutBmut pab1-1]